MISAPICAPNPTPPVAIAVGALHLPSGNFATTMPLPARPLHKNPALTTVKIARPLASLMTETGIIVSNPFSISSLPET